MKKTTPLRILIVDDHAMVKEGLELLLKNSPELTVKIHLADNGKDAIRQFNSALFDVVLMDIKMPVMDGIEATKVLTHKYDAKIIALSMHSEIIFVEKMLQAGARGYLLKNASREELIEAIEKVVKGDFYYALELSNKLLARQSVVNKYVNKKTVSRAKDAFEITLREREILELIVRQHTNEEIAKKLNLSRKTVDSHRRNIMQKMNVKNTAGMIKLVMDNHLL